MYEDSIVWIVEISNKEVSCKCSTYDLLDLLHSILQFYTIG